MELYTSLTRLKMVMNGGVMPPMEMGSHLVELVYVPSEPSDPALTVEELNRKL